MLDAAVTPAMGISYLRSATGWLGDVEIRHPLVPDGLERWCCAVGAFRAGRWVGRGLRSALTFRWLDTWLRCGSTGALFGARLFEVLALLQQIFDDVLQGAAVLDGHRTLFVDLEQRIEQHGQHFRIDHLADE